MTATTAAVLVIGQSTAHAINRYTILPNSPKPAVCNNSGTIPAGTWIQNKVCGYFVGTAMAGSSFDVESTASSNYHWGRNYGNNNICGWIPPGALSSSPTGTANPSCSDTTKANLSHRLSFGHDFNAEAHTVNGGTAVSANTACGAYYNFYTSSSYDTGSLRDYAGTLQATVGYRFTTNGANDIVVHDPALGWVFTSRSCVTDWRGMVFHNDND